MRADDDLRKMRLDAHIVTNDCHVRRLPAAFSGGGILDELLVLVCAAAHRTFLHDVSATIAIEQWNSCFVQVHEEQRLVVLAPQVAHPVPNDGGLGADFVQSFLLFQWFNFVARLEGVRCVGGCGLQRRTTQETRPFCGSRNRTGFTIYFAAGEIKKLDVGGAFRRSSPSAKWSRSFILP